MKKSIKFEIIKEDSKKYIKNHLDQIEKIQDFFLANKYHLIKLNN